jgi:hypothetical protein
LTLFRLFGFGVRLDLSWLLITLSHRNKTVKNNLLVVDGKKLAGTLALSDIVEAFSSWKELESES